MQLHLIRLATGLVLAAVATSSFATDEPAVAGGCQVQTSSDGTYEAYVCWTSEFSPVGYFAECFDAGNQIIRICRVFVDLSRVDPDGGGALSVALWRDGGGVPIHDPLCQTNPAPGPLSEWPAVTRVFVDYSFCDYVIDGGPFWIAAWEAQTFPETTQCSWVTPVDQDGPGGCPMAGGRNFPFRPVEEYYGVPAQALGIGIEYQVVGVVPTQPHSWGRIKSLYR